MVPSTTVTSTTSAIPLLAATVVDPSFGVVGFVAVLTTDGVVEIVGYGDDPAYWATLRRSDACEA